MSWAHRTARHTVWPSDRRRIRAEVLARWGLTCWLCKQPIASAAEATMDHVNAARHGGLYVTPNLRPAHRECNEKRGHGPPCTTSDPTAVKP